MGSAGELPDWPESGGAPPQSFRPGERGGFAGPWVKEREALRMAAKGEFPVGSVVEGEEVIVGRGSLALSEGFGDIPEFFEGPRWGGGERDRRGEGRWGAGRARRGSALGGGAAAGWGARPPPPPRSPAVAAAAAAGGDQDQRDARARGRPTARGAGGGE